MGHLVVVHLGHLTKIDFIKKEKHSQIVDFYAGKCEIHGIVGICVETGNGVNDIAECSCILMFCQERHDFKTLNTLSIAIFCLSLSSTE